MYEQLISVLDSKRFGFGTARFDDNLTNPEIAIKELKKLNVKLVIARVSFKNLKLINELEKLGFEYKDAQLTFAYKISKELPNLPPSEFKFVDYEQQFLKRMIEMTKIAFEGYGHYFANNQLDREKSAEIYPDWIKRCCEDKEVADKIIVAVKDGMAIGYLALIKKATTDLQYFTGVIGAVAPEFRNLGVFRNINIKSLHEAKALGATHVQNNVLVTNFAVMKTYTSLDYEVVQSEITLHCWIK